MANDRVAIITSAAYVASELAAEFGPVPPSFLPFGHDRLFMRQIDSLRAISDRIVLTLPKSFKVPKVDQQWLSSEGVQLVLIDDSLSLGASVSFAIASLSAVSSLVLLHGDTLFLERLPESLDTFSVHAAPDNYSWGAVDNTDSVITGFFSFSSGGSLLRSMVLGNGDFLGGLKCYSEGTATLVPRVVDGWLDFGHLQTYYHARSKVRTTRSFNSLEITDRSVVKTGTNREKIAAEAKWYQGLPPPLRLHVPPFLGTLENGYRLGYEANPTLHELFVFGDLGEGTWDKILGGCFEFLRVCQSVGNANADLDQFTDLMQRKTLMRLEQWERSDVGVPLDREWKLGGKNTPSLAKVVQDCIGLATRRTLIPGVLHGDFCFPNAFYDFRNQIVKVIDPRGDSSSSPDAMMGDLGYDLAKLNHSIEGYDHILAGRYALELNGETSVDLSFDDDGAMSFLKEARSRHALDTQHLTDLPIRASTILLFLSMLPLHADRSDRQIAFVANALRLYAEMEA